MDSRVRVLSGIVAGTSVLSGKRSNVSVSVALCSLDISMARPISMYDSGAATVQLKFICSWYQIIVRSL